MDYILTLEFEDFISLIVRAYREREREKAWQMWLSLYPNMDKKTFIPFSEFYKEQTEPVSRRPKEEILSEAEAIRKKLGRL
jgi:hypothetical protein